MKLSSFVSRALGPVLARRIPRPLAASASGTSHFGALAHGVLLDGFRFTGCFGVVGRGVCASSGVAARIHGGLVLESP